ncbi:hypothetical protein ACFFUO_07490 [Vibrio artabrorum]|uniref:Uncharacterized protein n=1 Tax=Vibrio artabrorum TaxID=446374 RepID=A0ABT8CL35_9VIBR|nr:hypothetical protein [Vibrio artabrorum]MDN3701577.1 hypothetical protein [Vibrio artabrorum]
MSITKAKTSASRSKKAAKPTKTMVEAPKTRQRIEEILEQRELAKLLEL